MMEPIKVWELEAGNPLYQVPKFQTIAEISNENTMENPGAELTFVTKSTGNRPTIPKATAPVDASTPAKLHKPDQTTATQGGRLCV